MSKKGRVVRLKPKTAEDVEAFGSALGMTPVKIVELAVQRWLEFSPKEALCGPQDFTRT